MLKLHDVVKLKKEDKIAGVSTDNIGAVIDILKGGEAYTVEFINDEGVTIEGSIFTQYKEDELILIETGF